MLSSESSGMGATFCTAGRFRLVAPATTLAEEEEALASAGPAGSHRVHSQSNQVVPIDTYQLFLLVDPWMN